MSQTPPLKKQQEDLARLNEALRREQASVEQELRRVQERRSAQNGQRKA